MNYHFVLISFIFMKRLFECKSVFGLQRFTEVYRGLQRFTVGLTEGVRV